MSSKIKAILFDKDGTLFHYGSVWGSVIADSLKHKVPTGNLSEEKSEECLLELEKIVGIDRDGNSYKDGILFRHDKVIECSARLLFLILKYRLRPIASIKAFLSLVDRADHGLKEKLESYDFSKTTEVIERCHEKGYILGIVTNDKKDSVSMFLEKMDPNGRIKFIEAGDGDSKRKPNPKAALKFMKNYGIRREELCIVGDTIIDMQFAKRASAGRRIALLSGSGDEKNLRKLSDAIYYDIEGILKDPVLF